MKITKITLIKTTTHADVCILETDLPSSMPNFVKQNATLKLDCAQGYAEEYLAKNFPDTPIEMVGGY